MCLDVVRKRKFPKQDIYYKVFEKGRQGKLYGIFYTLNAHLGDSYKAGKLYKDENGTLLESGDTNEAYRSWNGEDRWKKYESGFHCFLTEDDAISYSCMCSTRIVRKVKLNKIVAQGKQEMRVNEFLNVVVAKEMTILPLRDWRR